MTTEATEATAPTTEAIDGAWYNELGSRLVLSAGPGGRLTGTFVSLVGSDERPQPVTGVVDLLARGGTAVVGFAVLWPSSHTASVWAGQCDLDRQVMETTWLLTDERRGGDAWHSTLVGHNRFTRRPSAAATRSDGARTGGLG